MSIIHSLAVHTCGSVYQCDTQAEAAAAACGKLAIVQNGHCNIYETLHLEMVVYARMDIVIVKEPCT